MSRPPTPPPPGPPTEPPTEPPGEPSPEPDTEPPTGPNPEGGAPVDVSGARRSRRRQTLPEPPQGRRETSFQRWRRRGRRMVLRAKDQAINGLYWLISWIDEQAPTERRYFRVAIFGSSRIQSDDATYQEVRELARRLSYMGCDIVTGGGPGLMTAANHGARDGAYRFRTRSFGLTILLPMEEQPNPFLDEVADHKTFFSRLHQFIRLSHAYVVVDGGLGTTLEALMVWQLLQVNLLEPRPLIFIGPMWRGLREWIREDVIDRGLASPRDLELVHWVDSMDDALAIVRDARNRFLERHEVILAPPVEGPDDGLDEATAGAAGDSTAMADAPGEG